MRNILRRTPLYGLVLAGGKSTRMGVDKGALRFRPSPQAKRMGNRLKSFTERAFVSIRREQRRQTWARSFPQIYDRTSYLGPLSGLFSALFSHPEVAWLCVACDMPFVTKSLFRQLVEERDPTCPATVVYNPRADLYEPLLGIYEPSVLPEIFRNLSEGKVSLQQIHRDINSNSIEPEDPDQLKSVDTPSEYVKARRAFE